MMRKFLPAGFFLWALCNGASMAAAACHGMVIHDGKQGDRCLATSFHNESLCAAVKHCKTSEALCVLVAIPNLTAKTYHAEEAWGDWDSQLAQFQQNAAVFPVHIAAGKINLKKLFPSIPINTKKITTVFLKSDHPTLVHDGLFLDDYAPVEQFFKTGQLPDGDWQKVLKTYPALPINKACP